MGNLEKYVNVCQIGQGACGAVYLVRNRENKRLYALKKIELDENRKTRTKEAVQQEAHILAGLKHPHIVAYHDSFFDVNDQHLSIVQDYCDGGSLEDKINEAMAWFMQIAMAVRYMHSKGVLHRDLKTQNVFLNKNGTLCKLGDFGIAKNLSMTFDSAVTCVGTPCYLSPEICQDLPYSSKADVWALGCILFEILAQKPAFNASNLVSLFYKIVKGDYDEIPSHYSPEICDLVSTVLMKNPEDRPSARGVLALPFVRRELVKFIEEKEFQLLAQRLPTRNGSRPYSTPTASRSSPCQDGGESGGVSVSDQRSLLCRSAVVLRVREKSLVSTGRPSLNGRVSTIPEETDDQMMDRGVRVIERVVHPPPSQLVPISESRRVPFDDDDSRGEIAGSRGETAAVEEEEPRSARRGGTAIGVGSETDCESIRTQLLDGQSEAGGHVSPEGSDGGAAPGPATFAAETGEEESAWPGNGAGVRAGSERGRAVTVATTREDGRRREAAAETVVSQDRDTSKRRTELAYRSPLGGVGRGEGGRRAGGRAGGGRLRRLLRPLRTHTPSGGGGGGEKQHPLVVTAKSVSGAAKPKARVSTELSRGKGKPSEKKVATLTAGSSGSTKAQRPRQTVKFNLNRCYVADFDDGVSADDSDEEILEEMTDCGQSSHSMSIACEIPEIEEDLPDGQAADDDDDYVDDFEEEREEIEEELGDVVSGARQVCEALDELEGDDHVIVDDEERRPSTTGLIRRHCLEALGKRTYESIERYCEDTVTTDDDIRSLETMVGKENMKTLFLVTAVAKK